METIIVPRDDKLDIKFEGEQIASVSSYGYRAESIRKYSGQLGRWQTLELFKTESGMFVCQRITFTSWPDERDKFEAKVCIFAGEVIEFFGLSSLAKELYRNAKIEAVEEV